MGKAKKEKPVGIIIFGVAQIVFSSITILTGIIGLISLIAMLSMSGVFNGEIQPIISASTSNITISISLIIVSLILGILGLTAAIGLISMKNWGRKLLTITAISILVVAIVNTAIIPVTSTTVAAAWIISMVLAGVFFIFKAGYYITLMWYINKKDIKALFK